MLNHKLGDSSAQDILDVLFELPVSKCDVFQKLVNPNYGDFATPNQGYTASQVIHRILRSLHVDIITDGSARQRAFKLIVPSRELWGILAPLFGISIDNTLVVLEGNYTIVTHYVSEDTTCVTDEEGPVVAGIPYGAYYTIVSFRVK